MKLHRTLSLAIALAVSLVAISDAALAATAPDPKPGEIYLPAPLVPKLSANGKILYQGMPAKAVVVDPNPAAPRRKIPAPAGLTAEPAAATASFSITYIPAGSADPWGQTCLNFPESAKTAFNAAANIWANTVSSPVPIAISACWANLGASTTLGYSGGGSLYRDFTGAPRANTWYAVPLANALYGSDIEPGVADMYITYNTNFTWYYGTDGNTPAGQYDLMSVVLHEIAHGLNFSGSMQYAGGLGSWGYGAVPLYPNIYDVFIRDGAGNELINTGLYPNGSAALGSALVSNNLWFHGSGAMAANASQRVRMYAPNPWVDGSSYSHFDYATFDNTPNQLMVYAISDGESIHDPGDVARGLLQDLGWSAALPSGASFPWGMYLPAIINGGGSAPPPPPPPPAAAYWGVDNDVCCTTSAATFYFTLAGVSKSSTLPSCAGPSSWGGWATTTPGAKTFMWEWLSFGCSSYMGSYSHTLTQGLYHLFVLGWNGSSFTMTVYTGTTASSAPPGLNAGGRRAEGVTGTWQRTDELLLALPQVTGTPPKGVLKATN